MNSRTQFFCQCSGIEFDIACNFVAKKDLNENYPWLSDPLTGGSTLWTFGLASTGSLGNNNTASNISSPVQTIASGSNWKCVSSDGIGSHTLATKTDGTLWAWGEGASGKLGNNSTANQSSPVQTSTAGTNWKHIAAATFSSAALKTDGTLWVWGNNVLGQVGDLTVVNRSAPVQTVSNVTTWKNTSAGTATTAATKVDGTLWVWGCGVAGVIGNNAASNRSSPVQTISGGTDWNRVSTGGKHTLAIKNNGTLWGWGDNGYGTLGTGDVIYRSSPVQESTLSTNWKKACASSSYVSAGIKIDGTLYMWGSSVGKGLNGGGINSSVFTPTQPWFGLCWNDISMGCASASGISSDGKLWSWGTLRFGTLGNNLSCAAAIDVVTFSPVQTIANGCNWRSVAVGFYRTVAIREEDG